MTGGDDHGDPIAYTALQPGTTIVASDDVELGTVERVIENKKEHIFDGIVMRARDGLLWVDAPEVARIAERRVTLTIDHAAAARELTDYAPGAPEYRANVGGGRLSRFFGGGWKRH
jgi:hypothetical protein